MPSSDAGGRLADQRHPGAVGRDLEGGDLAAAVPSSDASTLAAGAVEHPHPLPAALSADRPQLAVPGELRTQQVADPGRISASPRRSRCGARRSTVRPLVTTARSVLVDGYRQRVDLELAVARADLRRALRIADVSAFAADQLHSAVAHGVQLLAGDERTPAPAPAGSRPPTMTRLFGSASGTRHRLLVDHDHHPFDPEPACFERVDDLGGHQRPLGVRAGPAPRRSAERRRSRR